MAATAPYGVASDLARLQARRQRLAGELTVANAARNRHEVEVRRLMAELEATDGELRRLAKRLGLDTAAEPPPPGRVTASSSTPVSGGGGSGG